MKQLKVKEFTQDEDICLFVNRCNYEVVSIIYRDYKYKLFYYE